MSTDNTTVALRESERKALAIWDALEPSQRSYRAVAERYLKSDGEPITEGRASGYVRESLVKTGRESELPARGHSAVTPTTHKAQTPLEMMRAALEQLRANVAAVEQRQAAATAAAEDFDADAWKAERLTELAERMRAAKAEHDAWKADTDERASKAADEQAKALAERAERVKTETETTLETLRADLDGYAKAVALIEKTE